MAKAVRYPIDYQLMLQRTIGLRLEALRSQGRAREVLEMEDAPARLKRPDYGACEACGAVIEFARIAADPAARRCAACEATR